MSDRPIFWQRGDWRERWMVLASWNVLHRIESLNPEEWKEYEVGATGKAVCGATGWFCIPGIFSRMSLKRCDHCCDRLDIPRGDGAPFNQGLDEPGCEGPAQGEAT